LHGVGLKFMVYLYMVHSTGANFNCMSISMISVILRKIPTGHEGAWGKCDLCRWRSLIQPAAVSSLAVLLAT